jgi:hypothetical protein
VGLVELHPVATLAHLQVGLVEPLRQSRSLLPQSEFLMVVVVDM